MMIDPFKIVILPSERTDRQLDQNETLASAFIWWRRRGHGSRALLARSKDGEYQQETGSLDGAADAEPNDMLELNEAAAMAAATEAHKRPND